MIKNKHAVFTTLAALLLAVACGESAKKDEPGLGSVGVSAGMGTGTAAGVMGQATDPMTGGSVSASGSTCLPEVDPETGEALLHASEINNYSFSSELSISVTPVKPGAELTFDWSGVNKDFLGHDVNPQTDIDMVSLLMWTLSQEELERKLNADLLAQRDLVAIAVIYTQPTDEMDQPVGDRLTAGGLLDFTSFGGPIESDVLFGYLDIDTYPPATHSYTVMAVTGTTAGQGTRMIQSFALDPTSENTHVAMDGTSTGLTYTADLHSLTKTHIPVGTAAITMDWEYMTTNSLGNEFIVTNITEALVARYAQPPEQLEAEFLDLELIADEMYRGEVPFGASVSLSELTDEAGQPFTGIDDNGTWIVALFCGSCANPAPWYLSVLSACAD
jgi:hypothetical protein